MAGGDSVPIGMPINTTPAETSTAREPFTTERLIGTEASINMLVDYMINNHRH